MAKGHWSQAFPDVDIAGNRARKFRNEVLGAAGAAAIGALGLGGALYYGGRGEYGERMNKEFDSDKISKMGGRTPRTRSRPSQDTTPVTPGSPSVRITRSMSRARPSVTRMMLDGVQAPVVDSNAFQYYTRGPIRTTFVGSWGRPRGRRYRGRYRRVRRYRRRR